MRVLLPPPAFESLNILILCVISTWDIDSSGKSMCRAQTGVRDPVFDKLVEEFGTMVAPLSAKAFELKTFQAGEDCRQGSALKTRRTIDPEWLAGEDARRTAGSRRRRKDKIAERKLRDRIREQLDMHRSSKWSA
jgi:hypothetical protein